MAKKMGTGRGEPDRAPDPQNDRGRPDTRRRAALVAGGDIRVEPV